MASGGVFLSWNVATGSDWPRQALNEGTTRSKVARQAAVAAKNAWLGAERRPVAASLHVLRLLFAVACSLDKVPALSNLTFHGDSPKRHVWGKLLSGGGASCNKKTMLPN